MTGFVSGPIEPERRCGSTMNITRRATWTPSPWSLLIAPAAREPMAVDPGNQVQTPAAVAAGPAEMTDVERCLAEAIGRALNLETVGPEDDFFEIGGDSIVSLQAAAAARRAGYEIDAKAILKHRTVRAMAREAAGAEVAPTAPTAAPAQLSLGEDDYAALASVFED